MKPPFLLFIHLPKTAGTSFSAMLNRQLRGRLYQVYSNVPNEPPFTRAQLTQFIREYGADYDGLASHRLTLDYPAEVDGRRVLGITFLRDPFDLFLSHYFYHRGGVRGFDEARRMSLGDYFEYSIRQGHYRFYIDWQAQGLGAAAGIDVVERARQLQAEDSLMIFPMSELAEACVALERNEPAIFSGCWIERRNRSKQDQQPHEALRREMQELCRADMQLLQMGKDFVARQKLAFPGDGNDFDAAVTAFNERCVRMQRLCTPLNFLKRACEKGRRFLERYCG